MAFYIQEDVVANIRNNTDIVQVVSQTVQMKKSGQNYIGLCPFHSEKTPSFTVSPDKQFFHCFGCGAGGNVFSFLMKRDGITFQEAVTLLGNQCGIQIDKGKMTPEERKAANLREQIFSVNELAMKYFSHSLTNSPSGKIAVQYLSNRGITEKTINDFKLGYVPDGWRNLTNTLKNKGISQDLATRSGLVVTKNGTSFYDRFRNRVIFPIYNISNNVVGFGGRVMDDSLPKYLNSPETAVYNKSKSLYGFNKSKAYCRQEKSVFIVEGYFDMIALYQHGIKNVVATLGTAMTRDHVRILSRSGVSKFVLVFDSDGAGIKAAQRSIPIFQEEYLEAAILILPKGYDPDSYIFQFGAEDFKQKADKSLSPFSFLLRETVKKYGNSIEGRLKTVNEMVNLISIVKDKMARSLYIKEIAEFTNIDEPAIYDTINKVTRQQINNQPRANPSGGFKSENTTGKWTEMEKKIVSMMFQFPEIIEVCKKNNITGYFENPELKFLGDMALNYEGDVKNMIPDLLSRTNSEEMSIKIRTLGITGIPWVYNDCIKLMNQFISNRMRSMDTLSKQIREAEKNNDQALLIKLMNKKILFSKELRAKQAGAVKHHSVGS